jgi:hypothetical protein
MNRSLKTKVGGLLAPDANEEYLFYQTLVGTWPLVSMNAEEQHVFAGRIQAYLLKALCEAKVQSCREVRCRNSGRLRQRFPRRFCSVSGSGRARRNLEFDLSACLENRIAGRARFLPGQRTLELPSGGPGQSQPGGL